MNRAKLPLILCAASLLGLCSYSAIVGPGRMDGVPQALASPQLAAGLELRLASDVRVVQVHPQEFLVQLHGAQIPVRVPGNVEREWGVWKKQLQVGDYVSLRAVLQPEGYLLLQDMHIHKGRRLKIWVSVFALILLTGIFVHERMKAPPSYA
jgi:hypothetical protein